MTNGFFGRSSDTSGSFWGRGSSASDDLRSARDLQQPSSREFQEQTELRNICYRNPNDPRCKKPGIGERASGATSRARETVKGWFGRSDSPQTSTGISRDEQKRRELETYLQNHSFHRERIKVSTLKEILPHLKQKRGDQFYWYEIFNVRNRNANKKEVESAYNAIKKQVQSQQTGGARGFAVGASGKLVDSIFQGWKDKVYKRAPHKDLWDRGGFR